MAPLPPADALPVWAVGARRRVAGAPRAEELIARVRNAAKGVSSLVALLVARGVLGPRLVLSAWAHLGRARERGQVRLRDRGAEFLLFVAGDDQLPRALTKVGIRPDTEQFVLLGERPLDPGPLLDRFGLVKDASAYPREAGPELLDRLGVTPQERAAVPSSDWEGLVLERVALLEMSAPRASEDAGAGRTGAKRPAPSSAKGS